MTAPAHPGPTHRPGPIIRTPHPWQDGQVDAAASSGLADIASIVRFRRGEFLCREGEPALAMFSLVSGSVAVSLRTPEASQQVVGFLFASDVVGHAQNGLYQHSAKAMVPVTAYRLPTEALERRLRRSPDLEFAVICKFSEDLLDAQEHAVLISRHRTVARLALFLQRLDARMAGLGSSPPGPCAVPQGELFLPMSRTEIASYLNVSPEAVSRSVADLIRQGVIQVRDRRFVTLSDRAGLAALAGEPRPDPAEAEVHGEDEASREPEPDEMHWPQ